MSQEKDTNQEGDTETKMDRDMNQDSHKKEEKILNMDKDITWSRTRT